MKAIRVEQTGGPEVLVLKDVSEPEPADGQVVVRMVAAGVNPVETYIRAGSFYKPELPYTPGSDGAGVVAKVGEGVSGILEGDRVYTSGSLSGTYGEIALCTHQQVHPLPDRVTFKQGAAIGVPYATAWMALTKAQARPGDTVLVHGASGAVGLAAVQIASAMGLTVLGTAGTDAGRQLAMDQGADAVVSHREPGYLESIVELTGGRGVDIVLEMLANVNLAKDPSVCAAGARIVVIGSRGPIEVNPRDLMARDISVSGMLLKNQPPDALARAHAAIGAGLRLGTLSPVVREEVPLADAPRAHELVMQPGAQGKIVLVCGGPG